MTAITRAASMERPQETHAVSDINTRVRAISLPKYRVREISRKPKSIPTSPSYCVGIGLHALPIRFITIEAVLKHWNTSIRRGIATQPIHFRMVALNVKRALRQTLCNTSVYTVQDAHGVQNSLIALSVFYANGE